MDHGTGLPAAVKPAPSVVTADFARLGEKVACVEASLDRLRPDVMDGHHVPNLTFGPGTVEAFYFSEAFARAGADHISFHPEVTDDPGAVIAGSNRSAAARESRLPPKRTRQMCEGTCTSSI